jgi:iron-sulfur cluster repair protein YtfE (RIC family)
MVEMSDLAGAEFTFAKQEHREFRAGVDEIHTVADSIGSRAPADSLAALWRVRNWFNTVVDPHAAWEDTVLYPEIDRLTHTEWATKLMRYEHLQIEQAAEKLDADLELMKGPMTHDQVCEIRGHLLSLESMLRAHMEREEKFLLPLLADGTYS